MALGGTTYAQRTVDGGVIEKHVDNAYGVSVVSSNAILQQLMQKAFSTHGAFNQNLQGKAPDYRLTFTSSGTNIVQLKIESGVPLRAVYTEKFSGKDLSQAALLAGDIAVEKIAKLRGYFAGNIAFVSNRTRYSEIYSSNLFFTNARQLTQDRNLCLGPTWSPTGSALLYTSYYKSGYPDIFKIDNATGRRIVFASFKGTNTGSAFNNAGNRVAVILSGTGNSELYTVNTAGKDMKRLTHTSGLESAPSFSPDGRSIVFSSNERLGKPQLFKISATGGSMQKVPTNISGYCAEPDWNPVYPNLIAFTIAQGRGFKIAIFDFNKGTSSVPLESAAGDMIEPCWLRDGRHLIYTARTSKSKHLVILDTETGKASALNSTRFGNAWQADYYYPVSVSKR